MTRLQVSGAVGALLLAAASLYLSAARSPDVPFIHHDATAFWITPERTVALETFLQGRELAPTAVFRRVYRIDRVPDSATLDVRAVGEVEVTLNGHSIPFPRGDRSCFKPACTGLVSQWLLPGENTIRAQVRNPTGPPLLHLQLRGADLEIATDEEWEVALDSNPFEAAVIADDTRPLPESLSLPTPARVMAQKSHLLLVLFALSCFLFIGGRRILPEAAVRRLPDAALAAISAFWVFLFVSKFIGLPPDLGHDAKFHTEYIRYIVDRHALPLASDGFTMYHPPLFFGLAAALVSAIGPARDTLAEQAILKLIPFLAGLGMVWVTYGVMRRIFPRDPVPTFFAVVFAGTLPLNVYMSAYVSNEPLLALLTGAAILVAAPLFLDERPSIARLAALSGILGLALMTKYTALTTAPVIVFFLGFKLLAADGASVRRAVAISGSVFLGALLVGGWVYLRNWIHFGDPLIWNLDVPGGLAWWQPPGFRTVDYYLGFGESLRHPFFSSFCSLWDAHYSSTWGEGAPPSIFHLEDRLRNWNYDFMSVGYLLAVPATALVCVGIARVVRQSMSGDDRRRRSLFTLVAALIFVVFFSLVSVSLRFPFWGGQKTSYALGGLVPIAICSGIGAASIDRWLAKRRMRTLRVLFYGWFGVFVAVLAASFGS
jgi:hypothetical protein